MIDVAINVFGKPWQTIVTLRSLLKTNGEHIDRIYIVKEKEQPVGTDFDIILKNLNYEKTTVFVPEYFFGVQMSDINRARTDDAYRLSLRYQYALEKTDKKYLFITHNDVLYYDEIIPRFSGYLDNGYVGTGLLGQCWNCPLRRDGLCGKGDDRDGTLKNRSPKEVIDSIERHPDTLCNSALKGGHIDRDNPMPLIECRLNEWTAMIDVEEYRKNVIPTGEVHPIGAYLFDLGAMFYRQMTVKGFRFKHDTLEGSTHAYFSSNSNGHSSLFDRNKYDREEELAKEYYNNHLI